MGFLEEEINDLRRRLAESPVHTRAMEQRLAETQRSLAAVTVLAVSSVASSSPRPQQSRDEAALAPTRAADVTPT